MATHVHQGQIAEAGPIEPLPEIPVEHLPPRGRAPALAFPARQPLLQAVDQVTAVGVNHQPGMARQIAQDLQQGQGGRQLHAVVGGGGIGPAQLPLGAVLEAQQRAPAPRSGVATAGSITGGGHDPQRLIHHWHPLVGFG